VKHPPQRLISQTEASQYRQSGATAGGVTAGVEYSRGTVRRSIRATTRLSLPLPTKELRRSTTLSSPIVAKSFHANCQRGRFLAARMTKRVRSISMHSKESRIVPTFCQQLNTSEGQLRSTSGKRHGGREAGAGVYTPACVVEVRE